MSAILRPQFSDLYGSSMLPVLEELFRQEFAEAPAIREQLFKVVSHDRDIWQSTETHDLPLFNEMAEAEDYSYVGMKQGYDKTLSMVKYGLGASISEEAIDDGKFDLVADLMRRMARSARESQEISAMNIFNNGFASELAADGLSVFNAAHLLPSGGTFRNKPSSAADLSVSSLETALTDFETQFVGDSGIFYRIMPKILLVHPSNKRLAKELIGSDLKVNNVASDNGPTNAMNSFKEEGLMVVSSPRLTDSDAWFLLGMPADTGLRIVSRSPIQTKSNENFDNDTIKYKSRYREKIGVTHAYGIYGNAGA
jgi:phage major head subunit gpT-like protein